MQHFPASLQELADHFARLPGVGGKTAQRLAFYVLGLPMEDAQAFAVGIDPGDAGEDDLQKKPQKAVKEKIPEPDHTKTPSVSLSLG